MPVSRKELDDAQRAADEAARPMTERVLEFLRRDPGSFYDMTEIVSGVSPRETTSEGANYLDLVGALFEIAASTRARGPRIGRLSRVMGAVADLKDEGLIEERRHKGFTVYGLRM